MNWVDLFPEWQDGLNKLLRFFGVANEDKHPLVKQGSNVERRNLAPTVRLDGLYQAKREGEGYSKYLRFFADGSVIGVSSTGSAQEVSKWFTKEWAVERFAAEGRFTISGAQITFQDKDRDGTVDYSGEIQGDRLVLKSHSQINDKRGVGEFEFVIT